MKKTNFFSVMNFVLLMQQHFMDIRAPCKEVSEELTRESLIAISYSVPDTAFDLNLSPEAFSSFDGVSVANGDITDHYRSELLSISDAQSPDVKVWVLTVTMLS